MSSSLICPEVNLTKVAKHLVLHLFEVLNPTRTLVTSPGKRPTFEGSQLTPIDTQSRSQSDIFNSYV